MDRRSEVTKQKDAIRQAAYRADPKNRERLRAAQAKYNKSPKAKRSVEKYRNNNKEKVKNSENLRLERHREAGTSYYLRNTQLIKGKILKRTYNLSLEDYEKMLILQKDCCAICNKNKSEFKKGLGVDHCHTTGKIRGLLCSKCNTSIGGFDDDVERLQAAINYLKIFR